MKNCDYQSNIIILTTEIYGLFRLEYYRYAKRVVINLIGFILLDGWVRMDFFNDDFGFGDSPNPRANKNTKYLS